VPPDAEALNVTVWPAAGEDGLKVKLVVKDGPDWCKRHAVIG